MLCVDNSSRRHSGKCEGGKRKGKYKEKIKNYI